MTVQNPLFRNVDHSEPKTTVYRNKTVEETKDTTQIKGAERVAAFLNLTGNIFVGAGSVLTLQPGLMKRSWKGIKKSFKPVRSGEKSTKTRVIDMKVKIRSKATRDGIGELRKDFDGKMATLKKFSEIKDLDEAKKTATTYLQDSKNGSNEEKKAKLEAIATKIDTELRPSKAKFCWEKERLIGLSTVEEGLKEVQKMACKEANEALKKLNHQVRVAEAKELKANWEKDGVYSEKKKMDIANNNKHKFDIGVRASIRYYVENGTGVKGKLREYDNNLYLIVPEKSGFIYIPDGDMEKITFIQFSDARTGKKIKDSSELNRLAHCHMIAKSSIEKGLDKLYEELVKKHPKLTRKDLDSSTYSYDFITRQCFVHVGLLDINTPYSKQSKFAVDIDSKVWDEMDEFINPKKVTDEQKGKLDGPKAFKSSKVRKKHEKSTVNNEKVIMTEKDSKREKLNNNNNNNIEL